MWKTWRNTAYNSLEKGSEYRCVQEPQVALQMNGQGEGLSCKDKPSNARLPRQDQLPVGRFF